MVPEFEDITYDLTDYEKAHILPAVIAYIGSRRGKASKVSNKQVVEYLQSRSYITSNSRFRGIISHIRVNRLIEGLIANSKGYWVSEDPKEIEAYEYSLECRSKRIDHIRRGMKEYRLRLLQKHQQTIF